MMSVSALSYCLSPTEFEMIHHGAACGVRRMVGLPLDPNLKPSGLWFAATLCMSVQTESLMCCNLAPPIAPCREQ